MRETVDLADAGSNLLLVLCGVSRDISGFDLLTAHVDDIRAVEIPTDANDVAIESVFRIRPTAPRANHPSSHGRLLFCLLGLVLSRWHGYLAKAGGGVRREWHGGSRANGVLATAGLSWDRAGPCYSRADIRMRTVRIIGMRLAWASSYGAALDDWRRSWLTAWGG